MSTPYSHVYTHTFQTPHPLLQTPHTAPQGRIPPNPQKPQTPTRTVSIVGLAGFERLFGGGDPYMLWLGEVRTPICSVLVGLPVHTMTVCYV